MDNHDDDRFAAYEFHFTREILPDSLHHILARIKDFNSTMRRRKLPEVSYCADKAVRRRVGFDAFTGKPVFADLIPVHVYGDRPRFGGWRLVGVCEQTDNRLLRAVPGETIPEDQRDRGNICDHCGTERRRKQTCILVNDDEERVVSVGSQCLKDFLGWSPNSLLWWSENAPEDENAFFGEPRSSMTEFTVAGVFAAAFAVLKRYGWISAGRARDTNELSTAAVVGYRLNPPKGAKGRWHDHDEIMACEVTPDLVAQAEACRTYWSTEADRSSEFAFNLARVSEDAETCVSHRSWALVVAGAAMYLRHLDRLREQERLRKSGESSEHFGELKKRYDLRVQVTFIRPVETMYGTSYLVKMVDAEHHVFTTFASTDPTYKDGDEDRVAVGDHCTIRATVTKHSVYNNVKETTVNRVVFSEKIRDRVTA